MMIKLYKRATNDSTGTPWLCSAAVFLLHASRINPDQWGGAKTHGNYSIRVSECSSIVPLILFLCRVCVPWLFRGCSVFVQFEFVIRLCSMLLHIWSVCVLGCSIIVCLCPVWFDLCSGCVLLCLVSVPYCPAGFTQCSVWLSYVFNLCYVLFHWRFQVCPDCVSSDFFH